MFNIVELSREEVVAGLASGELWVVNRHTHCVEELQFYDTCQPEWAWLLDEDGGVEGSGWACDTGFVGVHPDVRRAERNEK